MKPAAGRLGRVREPVAICRKRKLVERAIGWNGKRRADRGRKRRRRRTCDAQDIVSGQEQRGHQQHDSDRAPGYDRSSHIWLLEYMSRRWYLVLGVVVCLALIGWFQRLHRVRLAPLLPTDGISQALARDRAQKISALRYELSLDIPEHKQNPIRGRETIRFELADPSNPLLLDFAQP